jgi:hypothetical protein
LADEISGEAQPVKLAYFVRQQAAAVQVSLLNVIVAEAECFAAFSCRYRKQGV